MFICHTVNIVNLLIRLKCFVTYLLRPIIHLFRILSKVYSTSFKSKFITFLSKKWINIFSLLRLRDLLDESIRANHVTVMKFYNSILCLLCVFSYRDFSFVSFILVSFETYSIYNQIAFPFRKQAYVWSTTSLFNVSSQ